MTQFDDGTRMVAESAAPGGGMAMGTEEGIAFSRGMAVGSEAALARQANRRERLQTAIAKVEASDDATALAVIGGLLAERPNDAAALNLKARIEMNRGDLTAAESTLDQCIRSNPRSYYAFYNMARVLLKLRPGEDGRKSARKYYKRGRDVGGPKDADLERDIVEL